MTWRRRCACVVAFFLSARVTSTSAQAPAKAGGPTAESIRLGVFSIDPRLRLTNIGIDTNVFNKAENPERDTTATVATGTDVWLRTGRGMFTLSGDSEYVYFQKFASERSLSSRAGVGYEFKFNRLRLFTFAATRDLKQRPNDEISDRVRQYGNELGGGLDARMLSKGLLRLELRRQRTGFNDNAVYEGFSLKEQLNRTAEVAEVSWRQQLTALTTFVTRASHEREESEFQPVRNAESYRINTGFELAEFALIRGTVNVGYHELRADRPDVLPEYSGLTANINVAYTAPSRTRLQAGVERELRQSYQAMSPHYVQFAWTGTITQRVFGRWDVQLTGGRARQDYSPTQLAIGRREQVDRVGGGIGYAMANQLRAGFDIVSFNRTSGLPGRDYAGAVGGFSFTYGY